MRPQWSGFQRFRSRANPAYTLWPSGKSSVSRKVAVTQQLSLIRSPDVLRKLEKSGLGHYSSPAAPAFLTSISLLQTSRPMTEAIMSPSDLYEMHTQLDYWRP